MHVFTGQGSSFSRYVCRHEPSLILEIDGIKYYASDAKGVEKFTGDMVVNFTTRSNLPGGNIPKNILKHIEIPFEEIMIPWPDFGLPKVKITLWKALHSYFKQKKLKTVCFHCEGGHGRTGTALSAFMVANIGYSALEAVYHIRDRHCEEAVETSEQCKYLQLVDFHYNNREPNKDEEPEPATMSIASKYDKYHSVKSLNKKDEYDYDWESEYEWECAEEKEEENEFDLEYEDKDKLKSGME